MKNCKLLAVAFSLLLVGQIGAVEKAGIDPCESGKSWLRRMKKVTEVQEHTWSPHLAALTICARGEDGKNGVEDGSFRNLYALSQKSSQEGLEAKTIIDEFKKRFELIFHQPMYEKKFTDALKAHEGATEKLNSKKTKKNQKLWKKTQKELKESQLKLLLLARDMQSEIEKIGKQIEEKGLTQKEWTDPDLSLEKLDIQVFEKEMFRLINGEFAPKDSMQISPQDEDYDEVMKLAEQVLGPIFNKQ
jgi:hypothetical protein